MQLGLIYLYLSRMKVKNWQIPYLLFRNLKIGKLPEVLKRPRGMSAHIVSNGKALALSIIYENKN